MLPMRRLSSFGCALICVAFAVLVPGCGPAVDPGNGAGSENSALPTTPSPSATTASPISTSPPEIEPPGSTLSYGGETVDGGLGTFCWQSKDVGVCSDAVGVSLEGGALEVPSGAPLTFAYEGTKLNSLNVAAYRTDREADEGKREEDVFVAPYGGNGGAKNLRARPSGTRARIVADLSAGEYVVDAFATMPEGDASYGFRLVVED